MLTALRNVKVKDIHWPLLNIGFPKLFDKSRFSVGRLLGLQETVGPQSLFWKCCMASLISPQHTVTFSSVTPELLFSPACSVREQCCLGRMLSRCMVSTDSMHNMLIRELLARRRIKRLFLA